MLSPKPFLGESLTLACMRLVSIGRQVVGINKTGVCELVFCEPAAGFAGPKSCEYPYVIVWLYSCSLLFNYNILVRLQSYVYAYRLLITVCLRLVIEIHWSW